MIEIFNLINGKVILSQDIMMIPEFKALYNSHKNKDLALEEFTFVYYISSLKSIYLNYEERIREDKIKQDFISDPKWKPSKLVKDCIVKYKELQQTPSMRFLNAAKKAANELINYFEAIDFKALDDYGKPLYKATDVINVVAKAKSVIETLDALQAKVEKEISIRKVTGNNKIGLFEE